MQEPLWLIVGGVLSVIMLIWMMYLLISPSEN